ncbi:MAG: glycosyltransferase family 39 protein [Bacteroidetes bacterium]|nr:glycosyltransferase family 39 protein [Bacteroidota bacterium]
MINIIDITKNVKKNYSKYLLLIIIIYFMFSNIIYLTKDQTPTAWDDSWNLLASNYYFKISTGQETRSPEEFGKVFPIFTHATNSYPPFFKLSSLPLYFLFGFSPDIAVFTNLFFYLILIFSVYFLTKKIMNTSAALLACFIVSTYPIMIEMSRVYLLDFAFASLMIAGLVLFVQTNNFLSRRNTIIFSIILGLGTLTKIHYPIIIFPSIIFLFMFNLTKNKFSFNKKQTLNLVLMIVIYFAIISTWIINKFSMILYYLTTFTSKAWASHEGDSSWKTIDGAFYYLRAMINGASFFYFILFCVAIIAIIWILYLNKKYLDEKNVIIYYLLFFIVSVIIIFTIIANNDKRYILPIFPVIAIISSIGLWKIRFKPKVIRTILILIIVVFALLQINQQTLGFEITKQDIILKSTIGNIDFLTDQKSAVKKPLYEDWKIKEMMLYIKEDITISRSKSAVGVYVILPNFNDINLQMYAYIYDVPASYIALGSIQKYDYYDYLIIKEGDVGREVLKPIIENIKQDQNYMEINSFLLPDGTFAKVYKKTNNRLPNQETFC